MTIPNSVDSIESFWIDIMKVTESNLTPDESIIFNFLQPERGLFITNFQNHSLLRWAIYLLDTLFPNFSMLDKVLLLEVIKSLSYHNSVQ